jgi:ATP-dependent phosphofructokinase / diphosphate-dependent phosphofructokinase
MPLTVTEKTPSTISKAAILFAGGPAPAANAVISTAASAFLRNDIGVVGINFGYSNLVEFGPNRPLREGEDYSNVDGKVLKRTRNRQGIILGTARTNPGKLVNAPEHLNDPQRTAPLRAVYEALRSIDVDALVSIGGDDTLKTANKFKLFQDRLPEGAPRIPVVHVPKTIDNDYMGIDFTFGYFTAVETLASEIRNLLADAEASRSYFLTETMGRSAGWLAYGAAIAGEATLVISGEDIRGRYGDEEQVFDTVTGARSTRPIIVSHVDLGRMFARLVGKEYEQQTGRKRKIVGLQLGYESRCARPHAFDVLLGSQLGVGAYRALVEEHLNGVMVSVSGQLDLHYVPFENLVDPETLVTVVREVRPDSDFHKLARFLETTVNE